MAGKDITKITEQCKWNELTEGMKVFAGGTSKKFTTGEWRTVTPVVIEENCKHCLVCIPACPDSCIKVKDGLRGALDLAHCKGCGICVKACPFDAIEMEGVE